jgi:hypothetical protein
MRVLYSFPHRLGLPGIGTTAWYQTRELAARGWDMVVYCGGCSRRPPGVRTIVETMKLGNLSVPYRLLGLDRAMAWHDYRVARYLGHATAGSRSCTAGRRDP